MHRSLCFLVVGTVALAGACDKGTGGSQPSKTSPRPLVNQAGGRVVSLWTTGGLDVPESVQYDAVQKVLYVSCIHGKPTERNGLGYIAKLSLAGKVLARKWVVGLDAPKGMGLRGDTLMVTDITRVHAIDTRTGRIKQTVSAPEAKFLNDIAVGPQGEVYVSDMVTATIYVLRGKKLIPLVNLKGFQGSNGMVMQGSALLVGTATGIVKVTPADGKAKMFVPVRGFGMIDGLKLYGPDAYVMSNWKGRTQVVTRAGKVTVLLDTTAKKIQSADFEYIPGEGLLVIPTFFHNRVVAYRVR